MATSAGWAEALDAIFDDTDCKQQDNEIGNHSPFEMYIVSLNVYCIFVYYSF